MLEKAKLIWEAHKGKIIGIGAGLVLFWLYKRSKSTKRGR